jgi:chemotaxis protein histidine kinase CheA
MDDQLVATDLVSGASIMGDGTVALILNIPALVERVAHVSIPMRSAPMPTVSAGIGAAI